MWVNDPPRPEDLWTYYETDGGRAMHSEPGWLFRSLRRVRLRRDFQPLAALINPGSTVLDFGSGDGSLAEEMKRFGYRVEARDVYEDHSWSRHDIAYKKVDMGAPRPGDFVVDGRPADALVMRHVLEHSPDPVQLLEAIRAAGVRVVLAIVPNAESRFARSFGSDWYYWDPPRHLFHFSATSLDALAQSTGSQVRQMKFQGIDEVLCSLHRRRRLVVGSSDGGSADPDLYLRLTMPTGLPAGLMSVVTGFVSKGVVRVLLSFD